MLALSAFSLSRNSCKMTKQSMVDRATHFKQNSIKHQTKKRTNLKLIPFIHGSLSTHASGSLAQEFVSGGFNYLISEAGKVGLVVSSHASNVPFNYGWTCFHFLIHTDVPVRVSWWTFGHVKPTFGDQFGGLRSGLGFVTCHGWTTLVS
jgi:hypothetical protein